MFFKSAKKSEPNPEKAATEAIDQNLIKQIHVMPSRYYLPPKKSNLGLIVMIVIGLLIILVLSVAGYYLNEALKKAAEPGVAPTQNQEPQAQAPVQPTTTPEVTPQVPVQPTTTPEVTPQEPVQPTTTPEVTPPAPAQPIGTSVDSDKDNLTDAEEAILGTNPKEADTDKDGYPDGSEVLSGYDPKQANKKLSASNLFTAYSNAQFSTIYPATWRIRENDNQGTEVLFIAGNGHFFEVLVLEKSADLSLSQWLSTQFDQNLPQTTAQKINDYEALKEADNLTYYLMDPKAPQKVYLLTYNIGNATQVDFTTLFVTMVKNFKANK